MKSNNHSEERWKALEKLITIGIIVLTGVLSFLNAKDRLTAAFSIKNFWENFPSVAQLSALLLIVTFFLAVLWIWVCNFELGILREHLKEFVPSIPQFNSIILTIGTATLLSLLIYFSYNIITYSLIFAIFKLIEIWGLWIRDFQISDGLKRAREEPSSNDKQRIEKWNIIDKYYLQKPHIPLASTVLFISFISFVLGLKDYTRLAYITMIIILIVNEIVLALWRSRRDNSFMEVK